MGRAWLQEYLGAWAVPTCEIEDGCFIKESSRMEASGTRLMDIYQGPRFVWSFAVFKALSCRQSTLLTTILCIKQSRHQCRFHHSGEDSEAYRKVPKATAPAKSRIRALPRAGAHTPTLFQGHLLCSCLWGYPRSIVERAPFPPPSSFLSWLKKVLFHREGERGM